MIHLRLAETAVRGTVWNAVTGEPLLQSPKLHQYEAEEFPSMQQDAARKHA